MLDPHNTTPYYRKEIHDNLHFLQNCITKNLKKKSMCHFNNLHTYRFVQITLLNIQEEKLIRELLKILFKDANTNPY